jgi:hypothetical protein
MLCKILIRLDDAGRVGRSARVGRRGNMLMDLDQRRRGESGNWAECVIRQRHGDETCAGTGLASLFT